MKKLLFLLTVLLALTSCNRENQFGKKTDQEELTQIAFLQGLVNTANSVSELTRAAGGDPIAVDTTFRVQVYDKDADLSSATMVTQNTYRIMATGTETANVKANGQLSTGSARPADMKLTGRKSYDFYYFSPAIPVTKGVVTNLTNGVDYMALKESYDVVANNTSFYTFDVPTVTLNRLCTRVDVRIAPTKGITSIGTLELDPAAVEISGLANSGTYDVTKPDGIATEGNTTKLLLPNTYFTSAVENGSATLSTVRHGRGALILPVLDHPLTVVAKVKINGKPITINIATPTEQKFEAGKRYLLDIQIDKFGVVGVKVKLTAWEKATDQNDKGNVFPSVGELRDGGVVFWVNPLNVEHYKVMDLAERNDVTWAEADTYAKNFGLDWRLPTVAEMTEINTVKDRLDKTIETYYGIEIGNKDYWSSTTASVNAIAVNLTSGVSNYKNMSDRLNLRAVKESITLREPANCYVSYPMGGVYRVIAFNALKKPIVKYTRGNSTIVNAKGSNPSTASADVTLSNDIAYQANDRLEVMWQTAVNHQPSGAMVIKSIALSSNGVATVTVNGPGNAVLAYKRSNGTILWTYHIWATDSNPFANHYTTGTPNVNGTAEGGDAAKFMDRNLGALSATTTQPDVANAYKYFGILYQHGRLTPFPGQGGASIADTETKIFNGSGSATATTYFTASSVANVTTAILYPMAYYAQWFQLTDKSKAGWSWYNFSEASLWSDYGTNKSIYDPCPYGYRVPNNGSWKGWASISAWATSAIDGGALWTGTWWPAGGRGNFETGRIQEVGQNAYYWSTSRYSGATYIHSSYLLYFNNTATLTVSHSMDHSRNQSVRCVQEGY